MQYRVTCSTADGNQTKDFNSWEEAHLYSNEWMNGFTHWNHRHFDNVETDNYENLWKTRKGETVRIEKIDCPNCADQASIAAPGETVLCKTHSDEKHYAEMKECFYDAWFAGWDYLPDTNIDCSNCADQASIAVPGQTTLCKTHDDERHYKMMKDFFIEEIQQLQFKPNSPFCSCCGTDKKVCYSGMIPVYKTSQISTFSFCIDCRDELTLKKNAAIAAQERIGA